MAINISVVFITHKRISYCHHEGAFTYHGGLNSDIDVEIDSPC